MTQNILLVLVACLSVIAGDTVLRYQVSDSGQAKNCGSVPFNITWTPKVLSGYSPVRIYYNYTFPHDVQSVTLRLTVMQYGQTQPFIDDTIALPCKLHDQIKLCPVTKGTVLSGQEFFEKTAFLLSFPGRYIAVARVQNEKGESLVCALVDVTVNND